MRYAYRLLTCLLASVASPLGLPARAQITPDQTLGAESSVVTSVGAEDAISNLIEGGATRGPNLFHSFSDFNIDASEQVYFASPAGIESIISRITGNNISTISGLLGTTGESTAALILINPNGISFNDSARLDVQGAFTATTAVGVELGETGLFSAVEPAGDRLLSIQPSALFFSNLTDLGDISVLGSSAELQVPTGQSLRLLGNNILIDEGRLFAPGGIQIEANEIQLVNGAQIGTNTFGAENAGDVVLQAQAAVSIDNSRISSFADTSAAGQSGDIQITTGSLSIANGSRFSSETFGRGDAGSFVVQAEGDILFDGSTAVVTVGEGAEGNGGDVLIRAGGALSVVSGSGLDSSTFGRGDSGSVVVRAEEGALFDGSVALSLVGEAAVGNGGNVQIEAGSLSAVNGSSFNSSIFGTGSAGDAIVQVENSALFDGSDSLSIVGEFAVGQSGDVSITAGDLSLTNGSGFSSSTFGKGDAGDVVIQAEGAVSFDSSFAFSGVGGLAEGQGGNIIITAETLFVTNGSNLNSSTFGTGNAGDVVAQVEGRVLVDDSFVASEVERSAEGQGGDVRITAGALSLTNRSSLNSSTLGVGDAGSVVIQAKEEVLLDSSASLSVVGAGARGQGGDLRITAGSLTIANDSSLTSSTFGRGDAGSIAIQAEDEALFDGSGLFSSAGVEAQGTGGDIQVTAQSLSMGQRTSFFSGSDGVGTAGDIDIFVRDLLALQDGTISTDSISNTGGQIQIAARNIILRGDSDIQTFVSSGVRDGGSIVIDGRALIVFDDSDILAFSQDGAGGDIDLRQTALFSTPLNPISENLTQAELFSLEGNNRVDINATGATASGQISTNNNILVDNDLAVLPDAFGNAEALVASSCVVRSSDDSGAFVLSGGDRLPPSPNNSLTIPYSTGTVQPVPEALAIQEPQEVYQLANGRLVISRHC